MARHATHRVPSGEAPSARPTNVPADRAKIDPLTLAQLAHMRGQRLRELRVRRGYSQRQVAEALGVRIQSVSGWEKRGGIDTNNLTGLLLLLAGSGDEILLGIPSIPAGGESMQEVFSDRIKRNEEEG